MYPLQKRLLQGRPLQRHPLQRHPLLVYPMKRLKHQKLLHKLSPKNINATKLVRLTGAWHVEVRIEAKTPTQTVAIVMAKIETSIVCQVTVRAEAMVEEDDTEAEMEATADLTILMDPI